MATIRTHDGVLAFTSGNSIAVSDIRNPDAFHIVSLPAGTEGKRAKTDEDDGGGSGGAGEGSSSNRVLASGFSRRGRYFAVCDDLKKLHIFRTDSQPWTLLSSRLLARRATSLTFTLDESTVLVADKSGDVYSFPVLSHTNGRGQPKNEDQVKDEGKVKEEDQDKDGSEVKTEGRLLLGHLSMVLDVCLAQEDRYVVTCDRDEKIRVSHYPNGYNIYAFCLGHTQFVSCLLYVKEFRVLISGSGDGTVAVWNMQGKQLCRAWLPEKTKPSPVVPQQPPPPPQQLEADGGEQRDLAADEQKEEEESRKMEEEEEEEEEEERRAVRQLVYSERYRLLVAACYSQAEVEVYQLSAEDSPPTLTHLQTLPVSTAPWDIAWDDSNATLWVLSPEEGATLSAFQLRGEQKERTEDAQRLYGVMDTDNGVSKIMQTVNAQWSFFAESLSVANELAGLWKTCRQDNVLQYQQRKQRRLQGHQHQQPKSQPGKKAQKRGKHQTGLSGGAQTTAATSEQNSEGLTEKKPRQKSS